MSTRILRYVTAICLLICSTSLFADASKPCKNTSQWRLRGFMISTWGEPGDEVGAKLFEEAGFNVVMAKSDKLDLCAKHSMKAIVTDASPEVVAHINDHPAVWGYFVRDEPWNAEDYRQASDKAEAIRKIDRTHPVYVNLGGAMEEHPAFLNILKPDFLSFDFYQWWWTRKFGDHHFSRLESYRKAALKADLPLLCWVEANADPRYEWGEAGAGYLSDNPTKLRQSVYTDLAYGVKGIQWFTAGLAFATGPDGKPVLSKSGQDISILNSELKVLGPFLVNLTSTDVYHTQPVPPTCRLLPITYWVTTQTRNAVIGVFKDPANATYLMVVNRDWQNPNRIKLTFDVSVSAVESFIPATRKWKHVLQVGVLGGGQVNLDLPPGDGALLRVRR